MPTLTGVSTLSALLISRWSAKNVLWRARVARRWALHVLVLAALVVGVFRAGALYFYCPMMGEVHDVPCCDEGDERGAGPEISETECCKAWTIAELPRGAFAAPLELPRASATFAVLPPASPSSVELRARSVAEVPRRQLPHARTGPPTASVRRAKLGVYLI